MASVTRYTNAREHDKTIKQPHPASPSRVRRLVVETRWLALVCLTIYCILILTTYSKTDPAWSFAIQADSVRNMGGRIGARLADPLLYFFGLSAWWVVLWLLRAVLRGYRRIARLIRLTPPQRQALFRDRIFPNLGFLVLILCSSAVEHLRMYSLRAELPYRPGGVLGEILGKVATSCLGFTGATLLLVVLVALGFSLFTQLSWLQIVEKTGFVIEKIAFLFIKTYRIRQDKKMGQIASTVREEHVAQARVIESPPIHIEAPIVKIPQSERVEQEKQVVLFPEMRELPPLSLLDDPPEILETIPAETLEYTRHLIEKRLSDFGVSVRVVNACPGPVVTRYEIEPATGVKGSTIVNLSRDLARSLSMISIRVIETIPGKNYMALELPNTKRQIVRLTEILGSRPYSDNASPLTIALGKDIAGNPVIADLSRMPHLLVAGTTGS
ncbi:MAG: DNA translocase FtsK 4TM domain-containing protein, partial [Burkholderiaceae bacterium]|nr:DNA translocase FtsK 4TM domain-containing protein [Burkholderiaceae bacterium]